MNFIKDLIRLWRYGRTRKCATCDGTGSTFLIDIEWEVWWDECECCFGRGRHYYFLAPECL